MVIRKGSELINPKFLNFSTAESAGTSSAINLQGYNSALLTINWESVLSNAETVSFKVEVQDCATSGGTYSAFTTLKDTTVVFTATSGTTFNGVCNLLVDIQSYLQYAKFKITATTSTGTDNIDYTGCLILCDPATAPVSITFTS